MDSSHLENILIIHFRPAKLISDEQKIQELNGFSGRDDDSLKVHLEDGPHGGKMRYGHLQVRKILNCQAKNELLKKRNLTWLKNYQKIK